MDYRNNIIDRVDCPTCGEPKGSPCAPVRRTGHATTLRPHKLRAWLADGGSLPRDYAGPKRMPPEATDD